MVKYLLNETIHGYEKIAVDDIKSTESNDNLFVVIIDKSCENDLGKYYKLINKALKSRNRVILVSVDDDNTVFKPLASLMVTFEDYDIYQVDGKESISASYLLELEDREPDLAEVQTYIGGDVTAYSDMSTILFGLSSLVDEGNLDGLKNYVEANMTSIENLSTAFNKMKKTCDVFNSNELIDNVNALKHKEEKLKEKISEKDKEIEEVKHERDENFVKAETLDRENKKLKASNAELKTSSASGGSVIRTYKEINTASIQCRTKFVLYFKEITYVRHVNSLVLQLMEIFKSAKLKAKLIIYDTQTNLYNSYKPLSTVNGQYYVESKQRLISQTDKFVVTEPNPSIIQDILMSEQCFDVVIVYDRMKSLTDIVSGNNVTKFFVINSSKEYNELKASLKINDTSAIITDANSGIDKDNKTKPRKFLDIPTIEKYNGLTDSGKTSKYMKLATAFTKEALIDAILKKSRINTIMKK